MNMETPKTIIVRQLRLLWLRSKERAEALKRSKYCCEVCHKKKSTAKGKEQKIEVHHREGILNWDSMIWAIRENLLCEPEKLQVLCPDCHKEETYFVKEG